MNIFQEGWINFKSLFTSSKYVTFKGCTSRREYWTTYFIIFLISCCLFILDLALSPDLLVTRYLTRETSFISSVGYTSSFTGIPFLSTLFSMLIFLPTLSMTVRRLHDTGHSGLFILIDSILMFIGYIFILPSYFYINNIEGAIWISLIIAMILLFASFVFNIIILVFLLSKSSYENNKYRSGCCVKKVEIDNQSSCICDCNKENETNNDNNLNE